MKRTWLKRKKKIFRDKLTKLKRRLYKKKLTYLFFVSHDSFVSHAFYMLTERSNSPQYARQEFIRQLFLRGFNGIYYPESKLATINLASIYRCFENWEEKIVDIVSHEVLHHTLYEVGFYNACQHEVIIEEVALCTGKIRSKFKKICNECKLRVEVEK